MAHRQRSTNAQAWGVQVGRLLSRTVSNRQTWAGGGGGLYLFQEQPLLPACTRSLKRIRGVGLYYMAHTRSGP